MPPKKASSAKESASSEPPHEFKTGETVLCKVKGYPEWPGKLVAHDSAPSAVQKAKGNKNYLVLFFPDADYHWAIPKEMKYLSPKSIEAFLSDTGKKNGKLKKSYEIAKDPSEWEEKIKAGIVEGMEDDEEEEDDDVDMLADDGDAKPKGKKRKRASETATKKEPKEKKEKKETAAKKRKTDDKKEKPASKATKADKKAPAAAATATDEDTSEEAQKVRGWRTSLQKAFLSKGLPAADKMPEFDQIFTDMEGFQMQPQWLTQSKLGKVLKKMAALTDIARDDEFKITERSTALVEKWKEMMTKEGEDPNATIAGDVTMMPEDDKKTEEEAAPAQAEAAPAADAEEKKDADGDSKMNGEEKKDEAEVKTNGDDAAHAQTNGESKDE